MLRVGAATEVELKEKKHRLEDAISATRAAIEEGIIAGGGSALVHTAAELGDLGKTGDELTGVKVVRTALNAPTLLDRRQRGRRGRGRGREGGRARPRPGLQRGHAGDYGDLMAQGVIDPVKVTRSAVQNAASIAGMLLTTEVLVADKPEKEVAADGHGARPWARPLTQAHAATSI